MRLTEPERQTILAILRKRYGPDSIILLFGSRTDDRKKGGDIDLLVQANMDTDELQRQKWEALADIQRAIGDQKIDLISWPLQTEKPIPLIVSEAISTGVRL